MPQTPMDKQTAFDAVTEAAIREGFEDQLVGKKLSITFFFPAMQ
ncbi:hypothetical protein BH11PAT1_BH11PAT1_4200 [soil metagenome]